MNETNDKLTKAAGQLATEIRPERDLWPGIEEAINAPKRGRWTPHFAQAAAAVLLVAASSMVTYLAVKYDESNDPEVIESTLTQTRPTNLVFEQAAFGAEFGFESLYGRAGGNLQSQMQSGLENLSPEARADVEHNLAVIRQAIVDISEALEQEPNNTFLQQLLVEAYGNELKLINRVGAMTQRVTVRKDI